MGKAHKIEEAPVEFGGAETRGEWLSSPYARELRQELAEEVDSARTALLEAARDSSDPRVAAMFERWMSKLTLLKTLGASGSRLEIEGKL